MTITVAKQNHGTPRTYQTVGRLSNALVRSGAKNVNYPASSIHAPSVLYVEVEWGNGETVRYNIDKNGNADPQLAWDME